MNALSVNIGSPQTITVNGKNEQTGYFKKPVEHPVFLAKAGVENDSVIDKVHHGGADKACYLYGYNHYHFWKTKYPELHFNFGMFGENITVNILDENNIRIGDVFRIGNATIQVSQPRQPCYKMGLKFNNPEIINSFRSSSCPGIYVRVLEEGFVNKGDLLQLIERDEKSQSVSEIFKLIYTAKPEKADLQNALSNPYLAIRLKEYLTKKFKQ